MYGEVTERFKVLVLKTSVGQLTASSNLALSATKKDDQMVIFFRGKVMEVMNTAIARVLVFRRWFRRLCHCLFRNS